MKKLYFFLGFLAYFFLGNLSAQDSLNMEKLSNIDITSQIYNDCWGYVDDAGNEYAIVGTRLKILFYDITDPNNVVLVEEFDNGVQGIDLDYTTWRDFKVYENKAYACADAGNEGLIIFDLSELPDTVILHDQITSFFIQSHSIYIDESKGYLYTADANTQPNGVIILDLNNDPPTEVANVNLYDEGGRMHDLHVVNDTAYCNSINNGLWVYDFTDPVNPVTLGSIDGYPGDGLNHSCWRTESGSHLVWCDENAGRKVKIADVNDLENITITDQFNSNSPLSTSVAHNPFIKGDFVYVAYYHDGVYVFDISDPNDVTTHGYYDTNPQDNNGVWGVYPYFPSGNIIATDMDNGFYVLEVLNIPLPVELTSFSAKLENDKVNLEWATASEIDSKLFEIQKSADGVDFETIAYADAAGNSDRKIDYQAYDEKPFLGDNYYRLKQVDFDGKFEYSDIKVVRFNTSPIDIFPTLITNDEPLQVVFSENAQDLLIQVFSIQGQLLQTNFLSAENGFQQELRLDELDNGTFIVRAFNGNYQVSKKIVLVR